MLASRMSHLKSRLSPEAVHNQRTELVKDMIAKESAAQDAKTVRLRALRLAKEAEDKAAGITPPPAPKRRKKVLG